MDRKADLRPCMDCKEQPAVVTARKRELCQYVANPIAIRSLRRCPELLLIALQTMFPSLPQLQGPAALESLSLETFTQRSSQEAAAPAILWPGFSRLIIYRQQPTPSTLDHRYETDSV